ncbi:MAG: hypothetical protein EP330_02240 [Deltaproteobacteria bacterium]|nr:MAG: hypothetical protein EP330_02240 [Deltaproteobacteria bacterium]
MRALALTLLLIGCAGDNGTGDDTGTDGPDFDPYEGMEENPNCEDFEGTPVPGATTYFMGEYAIDADVVTGYEEWVLFANDAWEDPTIARPGWDCAIRWDVFGTVSEPTDCVGCTHQLSLSFTWNEDESDCQPDLQALEGPDNEGGAVYYVQAGNDGYARYEFSSGTFLGDGVLTSTRGAYQSEQRCAFF